MPGRRRVRSALLGATSLVLAGGCFGDDDGPLPPPIACDPSSAEGTSAEGLSFEHGEMPCLGVEMSPSDYDELAASNRFGGGDPFRHVVRQITTDCVTPFPSQYPWFESSLRAGDHQLDRVGVRKKGFLGSVTGHGLLKPSLKIDVDRLVDGQRLGRQQRATLNNNVQDATRVHTCLAYDVFARAGHPAPLCNLAGVMVNGEPKGAYSHVEPIKKRFLRRAFGSDTGSLYEGILVDFTDEFSTPLRHGALGRWDPKTSDTDASGAPLLDLLRALQAPSDELLERLEPHLNLESFLRFWALEVLVDHADGYTGNRNNFYVYFDPGDSGRAHFVPWGADDLFRDESGGQRDLRDYVFAELPRRLSRNAEVAAQWEAELRRLLDTVWDESALLESIDVLSAQVRRTEADPLYDEHLDELRRWIEARRDVLNDLLAEGLPPGPEQPVSCFTIGLNEGLAQVQVVADGVGAFGFTW